MSGYLIDRTSGTRIGNMTLNGGLPAAFDGNTAQADAAACRGNAASTQYVGKTLAISRAIDHAVVYPTTDTGYNGNVSLGVSAGDIRLYAKTGAAPANATDGTLLGTASSVNNATSGSTTIASGDTTTIYDHAWINFNATGTSPVTSEVELWQTNQFPILTAATAVYALTENAAFRAISRLTSVVAYALTIPSIQRAYGRVSATVSYSLTYSAAILRRVIAPARKFKNRVAKFVLQQLRVNPPRLDD